MSSLKTLRGVDFGISLKSHGRIIDSKKSWLLSSFLAFKSQDVPAPLNSWFQSTLSQSSATLPVRWENDHHQIHFLLDHKRNSSGSITEFERSTGLFGFWKESTVSLNVRVWIYVLGGFGWFPLLGVIEKGGRASGSCKQSKLQMEMMRSDKVVE